MIEQKTKPKHTKMWNLFTLNETGQFSSVDYVMVNSMIFVCITYCFISVEEKLTH